MYWYTTLAAGRMAAAAGVAVTEVATAVAGKAVEMEVEATAAEKVAA